MTRRIITDEQHRYYAAIHEAAHAVVGFQFGWCLNPSGVSIDENHFGYCGNRHLPYDDAEEVCVCVKLAGRLAENFLLPWSGPRTWLDLHITLTEEMEGWEGEEGETESDAPAALRIIREENPSLTNKDLILRFRHFERRTRKILRRPEVWEAITVVAEALVERGQLYWGDEPVMTAAEMVRPVVELG